MARLKTELIPRYTEQRWEFSKGDKEKSGLVECAAREEIKWVNALQRHKTLEPALTLSQNMCVENSVTFQSWIG